MEPLTGGAERVSLGGNVSLIAPGLKGNARLLSGVIGDVRAAVEELCGKLCGRALGYKFRHFARRNFSGKMIDKASTAQGKNRWAVVSVTKPNGPEHPHHRNHPTGEPSANGCDGGDGGDDSGRPGTASKADSESDDSPEPAYPVDPQEEKLREWNRLADQRHHSKHGKK